MIAIDVLRVIEFVCQVLSLRLAFVFSVTSWGRSEKRNKAVKGHPASKHLRWLAVDIVLDDPFRKADFIAGCGFIGLKALDEGDHVHVQVK